MSFKKYLHKHWELKQENISLKEKITFLEDIINCQYKPIETISKKPLTCPQCGNKLDETMLPNEDNDPQFGCQIFGEICSNCGYEHYDNQI